MNIPENVRQILEKLSIVDEAYLVGGCVRDFCMGTEPKDYDVVTNLKPEKVLELFGITAKQVGKSFGVVIVDDIEIATFRKDVYFDGVHTKGADEVEYAETLKEDLARRDLTINAMAMDLEGNIYDPFGGIDDLNNSTLKMVGNPKERIVEDPCRILRLCRFASLFEETIIELRTKIAMVEYASGVQLVAKERIRQELMKMMQYDNFTNSISAMRDTKVLWYVMAPLMFCDGVRQNSHHADDVITHCVLSSLAISGKKPLLRFAMLLHDVGKPYSATWNEETKDRNFIGHESVGSKIARAYMEDMRFSNEDTDYVCELIRFHMFTIDFNTKPSAVRRLMSRFKYANIRDLVRVRIADRKGNRAKEGYPAITQRTKHVIKLIRKIKIDDNALKITDLKINGITLMNMGLEQGPILGQILKMCLDIVIEDPSKNDKEILTKIVREEFSI